MKIKNRLLVVLSLALLSFMLVGMVSGFSANATLHFCDPCDDPTMITIFPEEDTNPIKTQHTFVATVFDEHGVPVSHEKVEWILNRFPEAVGDIVDADDDGKVDNTYAKTKTDCDGTTWITITATRPGDTDVTAYCPGIEDPDNHKVFATKHWIDLIPIWPIDAVNNVGTAHTFTTKVVTMTEGDPISGISVRWTIIDDDPDIYFTDYPENITITTITDVGGESTATIEQTTPMIGVNELLVEVLYEEITVSQSTVKKQWTAPILSIEKTGPAETGLGYEVTYDISVENTGDGNASDVTVSDTIPSGMSYVSSIPEGLVDGSVITWELGTMLGSDTQTITLVLRGESPGT